jgi:hypothetical protein
MSNCFVCEYYKSYSVSGFTVFQVEVIFVDFGNTEVINTSDLILLETLKKSVAEFPHQVSYIKFI